ncbi:MAG: hypothetical protein ACI9J2_000417 [Saprospiraceae bacterium]|jgi:hypothetical protein
MIKFITSCILACTLISGATFASGGSVQNAYYQDRYHLGKRIFLTKLLCTGCPMEGVEMDATAFENVYPKLRKGGEYDGLLSKEERKAAKYWVKTHLAGSRSR